jgi:NitT/TauT family transport system substrate-binding protein
VTLLLGFRPDVQFAPFYLAQQAGIYRQAGLEVAIEFKAAPDVMRLVANGTAQFGVADATDVMIGRTSGIGIRYVSTLYRSFPVALIGRSGKVPSRPAGLKGMRIGTPGRYGSSWAALLAVLSAGGLSPTDVTVREYPQFNQVDGLMRGDVDLITGFRNNEPLRLRARGMAVAEMTVDRIAPLPGPGIIAGDRLLAADPAATARAQAAVIADPESGLRAAESAVPAIKGDESTARAVLQATVGLWKGTGSLGPGRIDASVWESGYATMRRLGFIDGSVPLESMIAPNVLG